MNDTKRGWWWHTWDNTRLWPWGDRLWGSCFFAGPVYEVRLTRGRADDMARIRANGINACCRTVIGYASGRIGEEGFIYTEGGAAAWLIPWAHPPRGEQWRNGQQVPRRTTNPLAGYRDPAVVEDSL